MLIETPSRRLWMAAHISRLFPIAVSGRIVGYLYPWSVASRENAGFAVRSALGNVTFSCSEADGVGTGFALRGFSEWRNVVVANMLCRPGDTIVDIGSHKGTETLLYALVVGERGHVVAFEPLPDNFAVLQAGVERNGLRQVELHQKAVAARVGRLSFYLPRDRRRHALGSLVMGAAEGGDAIDVDVVALDELYRDGTLGAPRLIVMDAEGAEPDILRGAENLLRDARPHLVLEVNPDLLTAAGTPPDALHAFLRERGYLVREIARGGLAEVRPRPRTVNWVALHAGEDLATAHKLARSISRALVAAAFLPLWRGINPAVVGG